MLTKPPDYMISECGCPELWNTESKHLPFNKINRKFWNSYASWCNQQSSKFTKLLPLRESWTDYYTKSLMKQSEETQTYSKLAASPNLKQQKNHHNEQTKRRSFHFNSKRTGDDGAATTMDSQRRSRTKYLDTDIDQF